MRFRCDRLNLWLARSFGQESVILKKLCGSEVLLFYRPPYVIKKFNSSRFPGAHKGKRELIVLITHTQTTFTVQHSKIKLYFVVICEQWFPLIIRYPRLIEFKCISKWKPWFTNLPTDLHHYSLKSGRVWYGNPYQVLCITSFQRDKHTPTT